MEQDNEKIIEFFRSILTNKHQDEGRVAGYCEVVIRNPVTGAELECGVLLTDIKHNLYEEGNPPPPREFSLRLQSHGAPKLKEPR